MTNKFMEVIRQRIINNWNSRFSVTWWDVEHGLSVLIKTPNGKSIWIDVGHNGDTDFCPAEHVKEKYDEARIDCLIVSHPDLDHISSIDRFVASLGEPKTLIYNESLSDDDFTGDSKVKKTLLSLKLKLSIIKYFSLSNQSPLLPNNNAGVDFLILYNDKNDVNDINDSSVFVMCKYMGQTFIFPGDISDVGWQKLWNSNKYKISDFIRNTIVILTAPHHGRKSGYSLDMIQSLSSDLIIISDKYGKEPTYDLFRTMGNGLRIGDEIVKFYSTKTSGRIRCYFSDNTYHWIIN